MSKEAFLIIDPLRNTLIVPAPSKGITQAILEAGVANVQPHESERQLLIAVKEWLRESSAEEVAGDE